VTKEDQQQFDQAMALGLDRFRDQQPMTISGDLCEELDKQGNAWENSKRNQGPKPSKYDLSESDLEGTPKQIKLALARHLGSRAQSLFSSRSGEVTEQAVPELVQEFTAGGQNQYQKLGELAALAEAHLLRNKPAKQQVGLALAIAAVHMAQDQLHDPLASRALYQSLILPNATIAARAGHADNNSTVSSAILTSLAEQIYPPGQQSAIKQQLAHPEVGK
jgi:hypothetical protein